MESFYKKIKNLGKKNFEEILENVFNDPECGNEKNFAKVFLSAKKIFKFFSLGDYLGKKFRDSPINILVSVDTSSEINILELFKFIPSRFTSSVTYQIFVIIMKKNGLYQAIYQQAAWVCVGKTLGFNIFRNWGDAICACIESGFYPDFFIYTSDLKFNNQKVLIKKHHFEWISNYCKFSNSQSQKTVGFLHTTSALLLKAFSKPIIDIFLVKTLEKKISEKSSSSENFILLSNSCSIEATSGPLYQTSVSEAPLQLNFSYLSCDSEEKLIESEKD